MGAFVSLESHPKIQTIGQPLSIEFIDIWAAVSGAYNLLAGIRARDHGSRSSLRAYPAVELLPLPVATNNPDRAGG